MLKAFSIFDKDGDGFIDSDEMAEVFVRGSNFRKDFEQLWNEICADADTNNDGRLDFNEFEAAMKKIMKARATFLQDK